LGLPTLTRAIATALSTPGNTQGSRGLGGDWAGTGRGLGGETPPLRLIGWENEIVRVLGDLTTGPKPPVSGSLDKWFGSNGWDQ